MKTVDKSFRRKPIAFLMLVGLFVNSALGQETQLQYLSGTDKDNTVPWKFFCTAGKQSGYWTNIDVPSNWELKGFGTLNYFQDNTNCIEQGRYEHSFTIPAEWAEKRVFLVFEGVMTDTSVALNGKSVGPMHLGSFYRFKYEVTQLAIIGGENRLEVTVDKHSSNPSVNRAERQSDYWVFGGIFRPVYLEAVPPQFIGRVAIDARADGTFAMETFVDAKSGADSVEAQITDLNGQSVGGTFSKSLAEGKAVLTSQVVDPRLWTAETPNLYQVIVRLKQAGITVHQIRQRFGFRTMEVREGEGLYVNGQRVILKGCNRHSAWPDSGRCLSEAVHRLDINLIKDMNMNAVRMSHYPPDTQFLDLCDELGLYVLDELGGWQKCYDSTVGHKLVEEMIVRDVNHPCILFWDNGNEGGWNRELDGDYDLWDPQHRRVLHPWEKFSGVNTAHYRIYSAAQQICATNTIYMPTEFMHGLYDGGAGAGLEDYWEMMRQGKALGGGFIWALLDEGVMRPDNGKIDVAGNLAPDGIVGPYRQKEGSFFTIKDIWSPIVITETNLSKGKVTMENRFSFTDANQCAFTWELRDFASLNTNTVGFAVIAQGKAVVPSIRPGTRGEVDLSLPGNWNKTDALALRVNDPTGREIFTWVWPLPKLENVRKLVENTLGAGRSEVGETDAAILVKTGDLSIAIDKKTGELASARRGSQTFSLRHGPHPATGEAALISLEKRYEGSDVVIAAKYSGALKAVDWRIRGNGWVQCDYTYTATGLRDFIGVVFDYPEEQVKRKRWLGMGPYRVWKNRLRGGTLGVWENDHNDTITGWQGWDYPEFKGCFAGVRWLQLDTSEGLITVIPGENTPYVQVLTPGYPPAELQARAKVLLPQAGVGLLHAIPPIGNKFHAAAETGPQGRPTKAGGDYVGSVSFYFGALP